MPTAADATAGLTPCSSFSLGGISLEVLQRDDRRTVREDATRRTYLTQERTLLAWLRSGLAAFPAGGYVLDQC
jgi:uncharacterized membrane protein YidH (DUF202 family)